MKRIKSSISVVFLFLLRNDYIIYYHRNGRAQIFCSLLFSNDAILYMYIYVLLLLLL